jgi:plastocyanin
MVRLLTSAIGAVVLLASSSFAAPIARQGKNYARSNEGSMDSSDMTPEEMMMASSSSMADMPVETYVPPMDDKSMMGDMTPPPMMEEPPMPMPTYGSGYNNWGSDYDDCVQKCVATYGEPEYKEWTPEQPTETGDSTSGAIHTVMVAPIDGVMKYLPFALNATVGDTVRFVWTGTAKHSVTMGSQLSLCSKSEASDSFDSGLLSGEGGEQTFDMKVETDETRYFFCSAADGAHCSNGMWGMINPSSNFGGSDTIGSMMNDWVESNPDLKAAWSVVQNSTSGTLADTWGNSISVKDIPADQYVNVAQNTIWTRANLAANPGMQEFQHGAATPDGSPIKIVGDLNTLLASTIEVSNTTQSAPTPDASTTTTPATSGALPRGVASTALLTVGMVLASVLML